MVREQQLTKSGSPSEDLAKTTQQIVESRDIKALVKTAAEAVDQQTESSQGLYYILTDQTLGSRWLKQRIFMLTDIESQCQSFVSKQTLHKI